MICNFKMIGRVTLWHCKKRARIIVIISLTIFLLLYGCAWRNDELSELFTSYLGGFRQSAQLALLWLAVHLPVEGLVYGWIMNQANRLYYAKLLKYESKMSYFLFMIIAALVQLILYYGIGYGTLTVLYHEENIRLILWQLSLTSLESLNIVLVAAAFSLFYPKLENIAFPAVIAAELGNCLLCGSNERLRFLPFTYGKLVLQKDFFDNGIALAISLLMLGVLLAFVGILWLRKDERSRGS